MRATSLALAAWLAAAGLAARAKADTTRARADSARAGAAASPTLVREVFAYEGGGRDPFLSLLKSGDVRPLIADLKVVTIVYDQRFPGRSVAVLRDITTQKRYRVKTGDIVGRLKVTQIRPPDVVFTVQEFRFERQATLPLGKQ